MSLFFSLLCLWYFTLKCKFYIIGFSDHRMVITTNRWSISFIRHNLKKQFFFWTYESEAFCIFFLKKRKHRCNPCRRIRDMSNTEPCAFYTTTVTVHVRFVPHGIAQSGSLQRCVSIQLSRNCRRYNPLWKGLFPTSTNPDAAHIL